MRDESKDESCCGKPDLKKEAQRTNRFNPDTPNNFASSNSMPCNHLESNSGVNNVYTTQEKDDVPCINIILKPVLDEKTDQKDKGIQIVEITAVTENVNAHPTNNADTLLPNHYRSSSKETEKVETRCVKVQTEPERNIRDTSTQTSETTTNQKNIGISLTREGTRETAMGNFSGSKNVTDADINKPNRGVQFKDYNSGISSKQSPSTAINPNAQSLPHENALCNRNAASIINISDLTTSHIADIQRTRSTGQETPVASVDRFESMETLYKSVNNKDKSSGASLLKTCVKKGGRGTQGKLSDRIKCNIDKLEMGNCVSTQSSAHATNTSHETQLESIRTQTNLLPCNDVCKNIASRAELFKTYSDKSNTSGANSSLATQNTSTLASIFSNNPPVPKISLDTTGTVEWELPSNIKSSKTTLGTTVSDSCFSLGPDNTSCCSSKKLCNEGEIGIPRNVTLDKDYSTNVSCQQQYSENERTIISEDLNKKSDRGKNDIEKFNGGTGTRGFWADENTALSNLGTNRNSSVRTRSTNTPDEAKTSLPKDHLPSVNSNMLRLGQVEENVDYGKHCKSAAVQTNSVSFSPAPEYSAIPNAKFGDKPNFILTRSNTRNILTGSDLTRPEFIRMLTEIKEHTCSLEMQLSTMNEAMKRKQATRNKALTSTQKNYEPTWRDNVAHKTRNKKIKTANELSSVENVRLTPEEFNIEISMDNSCCASPDDNLLSENRQLENETWDNETCCGGTVTSEPNESYTPLNSRRKLKTSSHAVWSDKPEEIISVRDGSNISVSKQRSRKPAFKTKRSYLWAPLRQSDYRIWKQKQRKFTPSVKSMIVPKILSQSVSPKSDQFMIRSKIEVSCSPTSCCEMPEPSLQTMFNAGNLSPIRKSEKSDLAERSATHSNPSINRMTVRPSFMSSTLKKSVKTSPRTKHRPVTKSESNSSHKVSQDLYVAQKSLECKAMSATMASPCDLDTSNYSSNGREFSQSTKVEPVLMSLEQSQERVAPTSPFKLKRPKVRPRLELKSSSFKYRTKNHPKSIPSNSIRPSSPSRELFYESSMNITSKKERTQLDAMKLSPFQLKKLGVAPRLKLRLVHNGNPASQTRVGNNNSQVHLDPACCSLAKDDEIISKDNSPSSHSNRPRSLPAEKILTTLLDRKQGKDHFAYTIKTEQNTPFSVNKISKLDSEEEMSSTDYGFNKSDQKHSGKKRKRYSRGKNFSEVGQKSGFSNPNSSEVRNCSTNSQSTQPQDQRRYDFKNKKNSQSVSSDQHSNVIQEFNQNNSKANDSKCTIRVTVSLDDTPSIEEVEKVLKR